ncbi:MAG: YfhO family protein [Bacteroidetes bacterium]|nr:YfhO family protein [Bacteroidota bacterium]
MKKSIPPSSAPWKGHLFAVILLGALALLYNYPVLSGKGLRMEDMTQVQGMAKELQDAKAKTGHYPLWTNSLFGGMPAYQIAMETPYSLIQYVGRIFYVWLPEPANLMLLSMLGMYFLLVVWGCSRQLSILGALAFALSSYNIIIIDAGHVTKALAIGLMPPVLAGLHLLFTGRSLFGLAVLAPALALQLFAYHYQITYYLGLMIALYVLYALVEHLRRGALKAWTLSSALALLALVLALGSNWTHFALTNEYAKETMRGGSDLLKLQNKGDNGLDREYALKWSNGITETGTLLIPNLMGGASQTPLDKGSATYETLVSAGVPESQALAFVEAGVPTYFGDQPGVAGPTYFGALMIFLFVLGLLTLKGSLRFWLLACVLVSVALSWGRNTPGFTNLLMDYLPYYNKFRAVAMSLVMASLAVPLLAVLFVRALLNGELDRTQLLSRLNTTFAVLGGICLLLAVAGSMFFDFSTALDDSEQWKGINGLVDAFRDDRAELLSKDAWKSLLVMALGYAALRAYLQNRLKASLLVPALLVISTVDLWVTDRRYLSESDFERKSRLEVPFEMTEADRVILNNETALHYRVLDFGQQNPYNENRAGYFHKSLGGYHAAKLSRFEDVKNKYLGGQGEGPKQNILNAFNVRWVIYPPQEQGQAPVAMPNPAALGNAWLVRSLRVVPDAQAEFDSLGVVDLGQVAVMDKAMAGPMVSGSYNVDSQAYIRLVSYAPDTMRYEYSNSSASFAVFSEVYYAHGWNAYVDGQPVPHKRVNYLLRGLEMPAGEHKVEFRFEPATYIGGEKISLAFNLALLAVVGFAAWKGFRPSNTTTFNKSQSEPQP